MNSVIKKYQKKSVAISLDEYLKISNKISTVALGICRLKCTKINFKASKKNVQACYNLIISVWSRHGILQIVSSIKSL